MRLLVVEDDDDLASALRVGLGRAGYAVDIALTGGDAAAKLAVHTYDLLVLDLNLPDVDGFTLCRDVRDGSIGGPSGGSSCSRPGASWPTASGASTRAPTTIS
jgi:DNA-binding response OmpR family regulator